MKQVLAAVVLVLVSVVSLDAASITYEHAFDVEAEQFYSRDELFNGGPKYALPGPYDFWTPPPFDFSLGIPEVLLIDIEGTMTISGRIHDLDGNSSVDLFAIAHVTNFFGDGSQTGIGGGWLTTCTSAPCDFLSGPFEPFSNSGYVLPTPDHTGWDVPFWLIDSPSGITVPIPGFYTMDTFFNLNTSLGDLAFTPITIRTQVTGVARATYIYEPAAIPEPTTLLLLGSGLIAARVRRSRRHG